MTGTAQGGYRRKLIEVALPLEAINRESAREKSIRHGHPSTLHLWWARRPLAACRAVLFAQLVDDPSARLEEFPSEEDQILERKRLFDIIERLVKWENIHDEGLLAEAHAEIERSCGGNLPPILDPFAGGGSIPLEAQRLGLEAHASDLNPVAVLINKALIEIPPWWAGRPPVFPGAAETAHSWPGATGLAEDVRRYGQWMRDEAEKRIGHLYPKAKLPDGSEATVIAWLWARTVTCPNPACGATMPLVSTYWLSKKKDRPTWLQPIVEGKSVRFEVRIDPAGPPDPPKQGRGAKFACAVCGDVTADDYVKAEGKAGRMGAQLLAVVAEGARQRVYLPATDEHVQAAQVARPQDVPEEVLADDPRNIWCVNYGLTTFGDLFTNRQLVALTTFSDLVREAREKAAEDAAAAGLSDTDVQAYGSAVATYLALATSRTTDLNNSIVTWSNSRDQARNLFARQAIPMAWDFVEVNPFSTSAGDVGISLDTARKVIAPLPASGSGCVAQADASCLELGEGTVVATDPPYYDNIGYADLADFFYVWLRRSIGAFYPDITGTMLTPKAEELVATPYRFGGSREKAKRHFEEGFLRAFSRIRRNHPRDIPLTVFYAFKQVESDDETGTAASTGWETMLEGLIRAGFAVTATWPVRTERSGRSTGIGTNALASSIVLACRPRDDDAGATDRRGLIAALRAELPDKLRELQQGSIAPVDLAQAAIGPGMAVFSRYARVSEPDGSAMRVRTALQLINQVLAEVLSEQEGDFDVDTRWCVKWFESYGFDPGRYGEAETLSKAVNTSVEGLVRAGVLTSRAGKVRLLPPAELPEGYDPAADGRVSVWEVVAHLARLLATKGGDDAARLMAAAGRRVDLDTAKELAYLLYSICERRGWAQHAILFNGLGTSWTDLAAAARSAAATGPRPVAQTFDFDDAGNG